jgi:hypothetical protein
MRRKLKTNKKYKRYKKTKIYNIPGLLRPQVPILVVYIA